ncbi:MAG: hypothetical protein R3B84_03670 [Zavarzinella sp.]
MMQVCMMLVSLLGSMNPAALSKEISWQTDYATARNVAIKANKPLVTVIASGKEGWKQVFKDQQLSAETVAKLQSGFVCLYVDKTTPMGTSLAQTLEVGEKGVVISNKTVTHQAYHVTGEVTCKEFCSALTKYETTEKVTTTETIVNGAPAVYYSSNCANGNCSRTATTAGYYYPATTGNCPNGNCPTATTTAGYYYPATTGNCPNGNCPTAGTTVQPATYYYPATSNCPNGNCPNR